MPQKNDIFIGANYGWDSGEDGWGDGMNTTLLINAFLHNRRIDGIVSTLPTSPTEGSAYFHSTDLKTYFRVDGSWYFLETPVGFKFILKSTEQQYRFNGTALELYDVVQDLSTLSPTTWLSTEGLSYVIDTLIDSEGYKGQWDASTNTPTLTSGVGTLGDYYQVSVAGATDLDGTDEWEKSDLVIFNGTAWVKREAFGVKSVNGQTGNIVNETDTVATLALLNLPVGAKVSTKGCLSVGDGGHGDFIVSATPVGVVNGYSCVQLANGNYVNLLPVGGYYYAKQFGLVCDAATNDSPALNRIGSLNDAVVLFPQGQTSIVDASFIINGSNLLLKCETNFTIKDRASLVTGFPTVRVRGSNVTLEGLTLDGDSDNQTIVGGNSALSLDTNVHGFINNLRFIRFKMLNYLHYGIFGFSSGTIDGLYFKNCHWEGFHTDSSCVQIVNPTVSNVHISGCTAENISAAAFSIRSNSGSGVVQNITVSDCVFNHNSFGYTSIGLEFWNFRKFTIDNCIFLNARMGLSCNGNGFTYSNLYFDNITSYCVEAGNSKNGVMSNLNAESYTDYGVIFYNGARDVTISDSHFNNAAGLQSANLGWGIMFPATGLTQDYTGFKIDNCTFNNSSGVRLDRVKSSEVTNCKFVTTDSGRYARLQCGNPLNSGIKMLNNTFETSINLSNSDSGLLFVNGDNHTIKGNEFTSTTGSVNTGNAINNTAGGSLSDILLGDNKAKNFNSVIKLTSGAPTVSNCVEYGTEAVNCTTALLIGAGVVRKGNLSTGVGALGDADITLTSASKQVIRYSTTLTANRTITLPSTSVREGLRFRVVRAAGGAFNLDVGGVKTLSSANTWCEVEYTGTTWVVIGGGNL